jgi:hypothetical protein
VYTDAIMETDGLTYRRIFIFWTPLAATWLMMAAEGPYLAAIIARLADPKYNLAAYGVAFSLGVFIEAPVIMMMSAATALVKDRDSYCKLRKFAFSLNWILTAIMAVCLIPPVFKVISQNMIGLPPEVARLTHLASLCLLPWPGAIGYRRFYQGILIRSNLTRRVAYGTVIRLLAMSLTALWSYFFLAVPGAVVGTLALSVGVSAEAVASRLMARGAVRSLMEVKDDAGGRKPLTLRSISSFYYPLALTSVLGLAIMPMVTFFMGQSRMPIESLAVLPVINSLIFIFRSIGLSYQEVGIALLGPHNENLNKLRNFALMIGTTVFVLLTLFAFTPLSVVWFNRISGLSMELTRFAGLPTQILALIPAMMVLLSFYRAYMVNNNRTGFITVASAVEVSVILVLLQVLIRATSLAGAVAAAIALMIGRIAAVSYLTFPYFRLKKK